MQAETTTQANGVEGNHESSHASRLKAVMERANAEDKAEDASAGDDADVTGHSPNAPPPSSPSPSETAPEAPATPSIDERAERLAAREAQRRQERLVERQRQHEAWQRDQAREQEIQYLRQKAAMADAWERASPAERMEMAAGGLSQEDLGRAWSTIGSEEWKELQRLKQRGSEVERTMAQRLERLEQERQEERYRYEVQRVERSFVDHFEADTKPYPLLSRIDRSELVRLANIETDALVAQGERPSFTRVLRSLEGRFERLRKILTDTPEGQGVSTEDVKVKARGRTPPKNLTQRAAQERASVSREKLTHKQRLRAIVAREGGRG